MDCRQFEDAMRAEFANVEVGYWRDLIVSGNWDEVPASQYVDHLRECDNCQTSLWQFFEIRHRIDYTSEPCFHVAYYSADVPARCLDKTLGMYSIATMDQSGHGVVIGLCPWCGVPLPTGASPNTAMSRLR